MKKAVFIILTMLLFGCTGAVKETSEVPVWIEEGFIIDVYADNLDGSARVLKFDNEDLLVSLTNTRKVVKIKKGKVETILEGLERPHGIDIYEENGEKFLYVAESNGISRWKYDGEITGDRERILELDDKRGHFTKTIKFIDDKLYISAGSSCNSCIEENEKRASILVSDHGGGNLKVYASGLRNAVFFVEKDGKIFATENGQDNLGYYLPPDEINVIEEGKDYGWPYCYGKKVIDESLDVDEEIKKEKCMQSGGSLYDLKAHAGALGLAFIPETWKYRDDILVAYHTSRTTPEGYIGYKVTRYDVEENKEYDFINGVLNGKLFKKFRPVDLVFHEDELYISVSGSIYGKSALGESAIYRVRKSSMSGE